jgi:flagellar hook-associated protein FlgK
MNTLSIARTGMAAAQLSLDASAHNIANAATDGFKRQRVEQAAVPGGGVDATVTTAAQAGENLNEDIVQQQVALYGFKANALVIRAQDAMLGALLDVKA